MRPAPSYCVDHCGGRPAASDGRPPLLSPPSPRVAALRRRLHLPTPRPCTKLKQPKSARIYVYHSKCVPPPRAGQRPGRGRGGADAAGPRYAPAWLRGRPFFPAGLLPHLPLPCSEEQPPVSAPGMSCPSPVSCRPFPQRSHQVRAPPLASSPTHRAMPQAPSRWILATAPTHPLYFVATRASMQ
jgi:hypothetical protein